MTIQFNKSGLEKAIRFDPKTDEETQTGYNPAGSKYFIATKPGASFIKDEIKEVINLIEKGFAN